MFESTKFHMAPSAPKVNVLMLDGSTRTHQADRAYEMNLSGDYSLGGNWSDFEEAALDVLEN